MVSKSPPSSSPRALRWRSQVQVASSEAGAAMRPTSRPSAAWRWGPDRPSSRSKSGRPSCSAAHRAACSTPTERGRASLSESTSTHWKSGCRESCGAGSGSGAGHGIRRGIGERHSVPQEAFDDALGLGLDRGVALDRQQFCAGVENPLDAVAEGAPVVLLDGEMAAEVEERALADLVADALGADEAESEVGLAIAGAGASAAHEHTLKGARGGREVKL